MGILIVGIIGALIVGVFLLWYGDDYCNAFVEFAGGLVLFLGLVGITVSVLFSFACKGAEYKAKIINRTYGTSYTKEEIFYAEDVIDEIRELDRKRIEINGNVFGHGEDK